MKLYYFTAVLVLISLPFHLSAQVYDSGDKVGIGTTSPDMKLSVVTSENWIARFHSTSQNIMSGIRIGKLNQGGGSYADLVVLQNGFGIGPGYSSGNLPLSQMDAKELSIFMEYSNKRVGIGTTTPSAELEVKSKANQNSRIHINTTTKNKPSILRFQDNGNSTWGFLSHYPSTGKFTLFNYQNYTRTMIINPNNQIGIGTESMGTHKLAVNGSIGAREVKVESSGWSDYVFKEGYKLKSLHELEKFIKTYHHLPNIPSEKEVSKDGIELGQMNAKLLEKIEEMTLYVIELNKRVESLELENQQLKQKVTPAN